MNYSKTIQRIHADFMSAGDRLLNEAKEVLKEASESAIQKGDRLARLGFIQTKEAVNAKEVLKKKQISEGIASLVVHYGNHYPNNKFITEEQVIRICKKYNLVCGPVSRYKGFVPDVKLKQIEQFVIKPSDADIGYYQVDIKNLRSWRRRAEFLAEYPDGIVPITRVNGQGYITDKSGGWINELNDHNYTKVDKSGNFICAPKKHMDTKGLSKVGALLSVVTQFTAPKDPVVLRPVKGGYLILAAWGDEASDEIVVNHKMN